MHWGHHSRGHDHRMSTTHEVIFSRQIHHVYSKILFGKGNQHGRRR